MSHYTIAWGFCVGKKDLRTEEQKALYLGFSAVVEWKIPALRKHVFKLLCTANLKSFCHTQTPTQLRHVPCTCSHTPNVKWSIRYYPIYPLLLYSHTNYTAFIFEFTLQKKNIKVHASYDATTHKVAINTIGLIYFNKCSKSTYPCVMHWA